MLSQSASPEREGALTAKCWGPSLHGCLRPPVINLTPLFKHLVSITVGEKAEERRGEESRGGESRREERGGLGRKERKGQERKGMKRRGEEMKGKE